MSPVQVVKFRPVMKVVRGYPLEKKACIRELHLPQGSQLLEAEDQSHDGILMLWVMENSDKSVPIVARRIIVTVEGQEFELSHDEQLEGFDMPSVQHVGLWTDRCIEHGTVVTVTGHVLEVL